MRERIELLGGRFAIEAAPDRGTKVIAEIPLPETEAGGSGGGEPI
jgi:signal transduction histidine kinase